MTCPEKCLERHSKNEEIAEGHRNTLYGVNGLGGLVHVVSGCLTRKGFLWVLFGMMSFISTFAIYGLTVSAESTNKAREDRVEIAQGVQLNKTEIAVHAGQLTAIKDTVDKIEKVQNAVAENQRIMIANQLTSKGIAIIIKAALEEHDKSIIR